VASSGAVEGAAALAFWLALELRVHGYELRVHGYGPRVYGYERCVYGYGPRVDGYARCVDGYARYVDGYGRCVDVYGRCGGLTLNCGGLRSWLLFYPIIAVGNPLIRSRASCWVVKGRIIRIIITSVGIL